MGDVGCVPTWGEGWRSMESSGPSSMSPFMSWRLGFAVQLGSGCLEFRVKGSV